MKSGGKTRFWWSLWITGSLLLIVYFSWPLVKGEDKSLYLIGETSSGHHQIELACASCHLEPFGGTEVLQDACENCHQQELSAVRDSHPRRKFTDPSNADRVEILDARLCVTCHREHKPEITKTMGVTLPQDFCFHCHQDIGEERSTHRDLPFTTCADSGCHNFHDNTALYEDFLVENADQPEISPSPLVAPLNKLELLIMEAAANEIDLTLSIEKADSPPTRRSDANILNDWQASAHAKGGVNCSDCHNNETENNWLDKPGIDTCAGCHQTQEQGFLLGKHGMKLAAGLGPMTPAEARIPVKKEAAHRELTCSSCHSSHDFNLEQASVEACLSCHDSKHVNSYPGSPHSRLGNQSAEENAKSLSKVTCATCHMPRISTKTQGRLITSVEHNQSANLRPSDKMLRSVCMNCHSLAFALDALADDDLLERNFSGRPQIHVESIDMALERRAGISDRDDTYR